MLLRFGIIGSGFGIFSAIILFALAWILLVAMGYFPALGNTSFTSGFSGFVNQPQFFGALQRTVWPALIATFISVVLSFGLMAALAQHSGFARCTRLLVPILAVPHALLAMAIVLLLAPTGWLVRWLWLFVDTPQTPPDYPFAPDSFGMGLVLALVMKETAFLLLMQIANLAPHTTQQLRLARTLGYAPVASWLKIVVPQLYPKMRLPIYAVLAFSASVIELPMITNSFDAPTLAMLILRLYQHPDLTMLFPATAGAVLLLVLTAGLIGAWHIAERLVIHCARSTLSNGRRRLAEKLLPLTVYCGYAPLLALIVLGLGVSVVQGLSFRWNFPDLLPQQWVFTHHIELSYGVGLSEIALTLGISFISASGALALALLTLCSITARSHRLLSIAIYLPLIVPQISLMIGVKLFSLQTEITPGFGMTCLMHSLFVLPYVYLSLSGSIRRFDWRYVMLSQALGLGWWARLYRVILPLTLRPVFAAFALGSAVSSAQYLPTLLGGGGRIETLMTRFMQVAAGGNGREIALTGLWLMLLVAAPFALAFALPNFLYRHRRDMRTEAL